MSLPAIIRLTDLQRVCTGATQLLREEFSGLIEEPLKVASATFARATTASVAQLIPAGLPRGLHGLDSAAVTVGALVERLTLMLGSVIQLGCLPQIRIEIPEEVNTPHLSKQGLIDQLTVTLRKYATQYVFAPVREYLERHGRYGQFIARALFQVINVDVLVSLLGRVLERI